MLGVLLNDEIFFPDELMNLNSPLMYSRIPLTNSTYSRIPLTNSRYSRYSRNSRTHATRATQPIPKPHALTLLTNPDHYQPPQPTQHAIYVCIHTHTHTHTYIHLHIYMFCVCVCVCACMCVCVCIPDIGSTP